jgi:hypothetical protein
MDFAPGRLADDQQSSGARQLQDWAGAERQMRRANLACANFTQ